MASWTGDVQVGRRLKTQARAQSLARTGRTMGIRHDSKAFSSPKNREGFEDVATVDLGLVEESCSTHGS